MVRLVPVVERVRGQVAPWAVDEGDGAWLRVHGAMTSDEVGAALFSFDWHSRTDEADDIPAVERLVGYEEWFAPGGLMVCDDATGVEAEPGCCCDLFEWRDWFDAVDGGFVDLGHAPAPVLEHRAGGVRVWARVEDDESDELGGPFIDISLTALAEMLVVVQRELVGFRRLVRAWGGEGLAAAADRGLRISG